MFRQKQCLAGYVSSISSLEQQLAHQAVLFLFNTTLAYISYNSNLHHITSARDLAIPRLLTLYAFCASNIRAYMPPYTPTLLNIFPRYSYLYILLLFQIVNFWENNVYIFITDCRSIIIVLQLCTVIEYIRPVEVVHNNGAQYNFTSCILHIFNKKSKKKKIYAT